MCPCVEFTVYQSQIGCITMNYAYREKKFQESHTHILAWNYNYPKCFPKSIKKIVPKMVLGVVGAPGQ